MNAFDPTDIDAWLAGVAAPSETLTSMAQFNVDLDKERYQQATDDAEELIDIAAETALLAIGKIGTDLELVSSYTVPSFLTKISGRSIRPVVEHSGWVVAAASEKTDGVALRTDGLLTTFRDVPKEVPRPPSLNSELGKTGVVLSSASVFFRIFSFKGFDTLAPNASQSLLGERNVAAVEHYFVKFLTANRANL
ncbi:MAG TPA: hypothetical protein VIH90_06260 [Candidatus Saccharimonadales bacterium]